MGKAEIEAFLTHLAVEGQVSASIQNQALSALVFLYREVLNLEMSGIDAVRAKRPQSVPTVLTKQEAIAIEVSEIVFQVGEDGLESGLHGKWGDRGYAHYHL